MKLCKKCNENEKAPGRSLCYPCYGRKRRGEAKPVHTTPSNCKMLFLDIETRPNVGYVWDLWDQNISLDQLIENGDVLSFSAKWYGDDEVMYFDHRGEDGFLKMVEAAWTLLNECDVLVTFYGTRFDEKHLNRTFVENGFPPPSPYKSIDLKLVCAKRFKFPSNKLQYVSKALGLAGKVDNEGWKLWIGCLNGDEESWAKMKEYNIQDTLLLEDLFEVLLPWIPNLPHRWLYDGHSGCPGCGNSAPLKAAGFAYTRVSKFKQFVCEHCGSFFRDGKRLEGVTTQFSPL